MKPGIQLFIALILFFFQKSEAQKYNIEAIPKWVRTIDSPVKSSVSKYDISSGFYLTLCDYQVNLDKDAVFSHQVINVVSYSGITNASQIAIVYDTSYQRLKIHYLYIWRNGKKMDRTKDMSLQIMNNENKLAQGIFTGKITAYDILNDIRKDDLIDYAYTLEGQNPIFNGEKYLFIPMESDNPVDLYFNRIIYSKDKDYSFKCVGCDSVVSCSEADGCKVIELRIENLKATTLEDNIPSWLIPYNYFTLSSFNSWKDVNIWAQKVFALSEEPDLEVVFNEIFSGNETMEDKINKIINYVQDDIRYMGVESGIGSIKPFPPEQTVKQRFGDCKDKSLLLVSLLHKIGIDQAWPVLVNSIMKKGIDQFFPNNEIFDHCIVTFKYNNNDYYIDPTIPLQGGDFKEMYAGDYGKGLIIGMPGDSLHSISPKNKKYYVDVTEEYDVTSFSEPAKLKITSSRFSFDADFKRQMLEYYKSSDLTDQVVQELKLLFPSVTKTSDLKITDDIEKNNLSITYTFNVDGFWQDGDKATNPVKNYWFFRFEPLELYQYLNVTACEDRKFDFALNYPLNFRYHVIFHFPKDMLITDDIKIYENDAFYYEEKTEQLSSSSIEFDYVFSIKSNFIKAADYTKICDQKNTIAKKLPVVLFFPKY